VCGCRSLSSISFDSSCTLCRRIQNAASVVGYIKHLFVQLNMDNMTYDSKALRSIKMIERLRFEFILRCLAPVQYLGQV
jgi:hypothetical protein